MKDAPLAVSYMQAAGIHIPPCCHIDSAWGDCFSVLLMSVFGDTMNNGA